MAKSSSWQEAQEIVVRGPKRAYEVDGDDGLHLLAGLTASAPVCRSFRTIRLWPSPWRARSSSQVLSIWRPRTVSRHILRQSSAAAAIIPIVQTINLMSEGNGWQGISSPWPPRRETTVKSTSRLEAKALFAFKHVEEMRFNLR